MTSRRFVLAVVVTGVLLAGLVGWVLARGPVEVALPTAGGQDADVRRTDAASHLVEGLERAWTRGRATDSLTTTPARSAVADVGSNVRRLGIDGLRLSLVDLDATGSGRWQAHVDLRYRLVAADTHATSMVVTLPVAFERDGHALLAGLPQDGRAPLWMLEPVVAGRAPRLLVVTGGGAGAATAMVRRGERALQQVAKVLPDWRGSLVVEEPGRADDLASMLDSGPDRYATVAALTTSVDGSPSAAAPVHVFVNPEIFDGLRADGAQVVITHEAVHVATGATSAHLPVWLSEGFADYVALRHTRLPDSVTAGQELARVRETGAPDSLPDQEAFDPSATTFGSSYEAAWLACRLIADTYGEPALVRFYRQVDASGDVDAAWRALGTTSARFTAQWGDYLERLARRTG